MRSTGQYFVQHVLQESWLLCHVRQDQKCIIHLHFQWRLTSFGSFMDVTFFWILFQIFHRAIFLLLMCQWKENRLCLISGTRHAVQHLRCHLPGPAHCGAPTLAQLSGNILAPKLLNLAVVLAVILEPKWRASFLISEFAQLWGPCSGGFHGNRNGVT